MRNRGTKQRQPFFSFEAFSFGIQLCEEDKPSSLPRLLLLSRASSAIWDPFFGIIARRLDLLRWRRDRHLVEHEESHERSHGANSAKSPLLFSFALYRA